MHLMLLALLIASTRTSAAADPKLSAGTTISLRPDWHGQNVCLGFCGSTTDVTVWADGQVLVDGRHHFRVSKQDMRRFRSIMDSVLPAGNLAQVDRSDALPSTCTVKVRWPVDRQGAQAVACATYSVGALFGAVQQALDAVHLNILGERTR